ncbi:MAG: class I SAM-dependent methyltransferase [Phycisphaerae bacterium]
MIRNTALPSLRLRSRDASHGWLTRAARRGVLAHLREISTGRLALQEGSNRLEFGPASASQSAQITVHDPALYRAVAFNGALGAGESFIRGDWSTDDLVGLLRLFLQNEALFARLDGILARTTAPLVKLFHASRRNTRKGSRRNIAAHYDLGNDFYRLFLDETMTYSAGIFERKDATLRDASVAKLERVCRKMNLQPGMRILEIGTGWGSFAIHAARTYGCHITTTTISKEQYDYAAQQVADHKLGHLITLLNEDYRALIGKYDRVVSIEMIEAVGHHYLGTFLAQCERLLTADGQMVIQAITMAERYYKQALHKVDFIKRFVFPGSFIPSLGAIQQSLTENTRLQQVHQEDFGPHYAITLRHWRKRFLGNRAQIQALGYSDALIRMWEYYLAYCEAGFLERTIGVSQLIYNMPQCRARPPLPPLDSLFAAVPSHYGQMG